MTRIRALGPLLVGFIAVLLGAEGCSSSSSSGAYPCDDAGACPNGFVCQNGACLVQEGGISGSGGAAQGGSGGVPSGGSGGVAGESFGGTAGATGGTGSFGGSGGSGGFGAGGS